jgi:copper homeostasis protein
MSDRQIKVEVCIESVADALTAVKAGADRVELCSALALGGLTPSAAMIEAVRQAVALPIMVLIRPRPGGFCYSDSEFAVLLREIELAIRAGADGIVSGALTDAGEVDRPRCRQIVEAAEGKPVIFHRAFDFTLQPFEALSTLIELGFTRILTSGQRSKAIEGADLIRKLLDQAANHIEILPGGGINAGNVLDLLSLTGCNQIHASARETRVDPSVRHRPTLTLASSVAKQPNQHGFTSEQRLADLIARLR